MISFPNAKINLGLYITAKRDDGFHDLETVFFPIPFADVLEFVPFNSLKFTYSGIPIPGDPENNLCLKAYHLLKQIHPQLEPLHIHLHKIIPMGAGLGGGSADGAFMLDMLNRYYQLGHSRESLHALAMQMGSDCPFFLTNKPAFASGRGEILEPIELNLKNWWITVVHPGIHISTSDAFSAIVPKTAPKDYKTKILEPLETWKSWLRNDFEASVMELYPVIAEVKADLYKAGAAYASMSGSGSAVYGFFRKKPELNFSIEYLVRRVELK